MRDAEVRDGLQLAQHPHVDLGQRVDLLGSQPAAAQQVGDEVQPLVRGELQQLRDLLVGHLVPLAARLEALDRGLHHAHCLLDALLPGAPNGHHLAHGLHGRADLRGHLGELGQVPAGDLGHDVVQRGLEEGRGLLRDGVADLGQRDAQRQLGRHEGQRVARGLGGQRRGPGEPRVHLDDAVVHGLRVERVLDVALAHDAEVAHHLHGRLAQHVVLVVRQRLAGRQHDGVPRVHAEGVEVLHVAHGDAVVGRVAHHLVLHLLPPAQVLVDDHLVGAGEGLGHGLAQLLLVLGEPGAQPAQREGRPHEHRVPDLVGGLEGLVHGGGGVAGGQRLVDLGQLLREDVAVLGGHDHGDLRAQHLHVVPLQHARLEERHAHVERRLAAHGHHDAVRALLLDHLLHEVGLHGQEVDLVRAGAAQVVRRLHGGDVGVDHHHADALLLQGLDGLRARVVELARLPDAQAPRAQQQHLLHVGLVHLHGRGELDLLCALGDRVQEHVEQELRVRGAAAVLRVELGREPGVLLVHDALVGAVVHVLKEHLPVLGQRGAVHRVAVVLRGDVALAGEHVHHGLVLPAVAEGQLGGLGAHRLAGQLVAQADAEERLHLAGLYLFIHDSLDVLGNVLVGLRVTGAIGNEEAVHPVHLLHQIMVMGHQLHLSTLANKHANDVVLDAAVNCQHFVRVTLAVNFDLLCGNFCDEIASVRIREVWLLVFQALDDNLAEKSTLGANHLGQLASVNSSNGRDAFFFQPVLQGPVCLPVGIVFRIVLDDESRRLDPFTLVVFRESDIIDITLFWYTVVSDHRIGEGHQLTSVRGVRKGLGVTHHASCKNGFTSDVDFCTK
mmetsp:Transcript_13563/g.24040  ORF Transcript_13563/g.24040 Transcript_13563/m.24040 type:complete len:838 (+) Transcript_13563:2027-4540(+)